MVKRIDSTDGPRLYEIPDEADGTRRVPSVTTVLGIKAKPQLVAWAAKVERQMVVEAATNLYEELPLSPKMNRMAYVDTLTKRIPLVKAHQVETERAFEIGRQVHEMVEHRLRVMMGQVPGDAPALRQESAMAYAAWEEWAERADFTPLHIEEMLYSGEFGYAGTCDVVADITVGDQVVLAVGDWKSSKAIYDEYGLQVAAYGHALVEMGHAKSMPHGFVARFPKSKHDAPFETRIWTPDEMNENLRVFLCLLQVWNWQHALDQEKPKRARKATSK